MFLDDRKTEAGGQRLLTPGGDVEPRNGVPVTQDGLCYLPIFYVSRYHGTRQPAWLVMGPDKMPSREVIGQHFDVVTLRVVDHLPTPPQGSYNNEGHFVADPGWASLPFSSPRAPANTTYVAGLGTVYP